MTNSKIKEILMEVANDEYQLAGDDAVNKIIENEVNNQKNDIDVIEGGNDFNFAAILTILSSIVSLIKGGLDIIEKSKALLSKAELKNKIIEQIDKSDQGIDAEIKKNIKTYFTKYADK